MTISLGWLVFGGLGAIIGSGLGYFNRGRSDASPFTANWRRGAASGTVLGLVLFYAFGSAMMPYPHPKNLKQVDEAAFDAELASLKKPLVVDFFATWCGPCKTLAPRLDKLAGEFNEQIDFLSVNVDQSPALAARFNVSTIPTLIFFGANGEVGDMAVGVISAGALRAKMQALADAPRKSLPENLVEFSK